VAIADAAAPMNRKPRSAAVAVIVATLLAWARGASAADTAIGLDADGALPTTGNSLLNGGGGFGTTHRAFVGGRVGVGELLVPFAFAHAGYGWRVTSDSSYGGNGIALDGGVGLDVNLGIIAAGAHVGYAFIDAQPSAPQWVILGLDGTLVF